MTRPLRVECPGAYYHVINRGNAGEDIFKNDRDKEKNSYNTDFDHQNSLLSPKNTYNWNAFNE